MTNDKFDECRVHGFSKYEIVTNSLTECVYRDADLDPLALVSDYLLVTNVNYKAQDYSMNMFKLGFLQGGFGKGTVPLCNPSEQDWLSDIYSGLY